MSEAKFSTTSNRGCATELFAVNATPFAAFPGLQFESEKDNEFGSDIFQFHG